MKIKYGKSYSNELLKIKSDFYSENEILLAECDRINSIYNEQPVRTRCKMCGELLSNEKHFSSHNVTYYYCNKCHHLNGAHEENENFCERIYVENDYGSSYHEDDKIAFNAREKSIYLPKMDFLLDELKKQDVGNKEMHILDIGAGSGYFVKAGLDRGIDIQGIEVSGDQVEFGNNMIGEEKLTTVSVTETVNHIKQTKCNIISLIGVLEHLIDFKDVLEAIKQNPNIKYMYFSVPMFSYSCIFETVFQEGYNRHMGAAHTHLFTLDSIHFMNKIFGFKELGRWQFGTDIMDLYRLMSVSLEKSNPDLKNILDTYFLKCRDDLQLVLDKSDFCSEVHMLVSK